MGRAEVEVREGKLKNKKAAGMDEITGEMIKVGSERVVDWIWRLCSMAFESSVVVVFVSREIGNWLNRNQSAKRALRSQCLKFTSP